MSDIILKQDRIILPKIKDYSTWSTIACDQFTSNKEYWEDVEEIVKDNYSTFRLILPEIYLNEEYDDKIDHIKKSFEKYEKDGVFYELKEGLILTVRSTPYVKKRVGLIGSIDLDKYEYSKKSDAYIRSTESTIEERIPPRLKIRENAPIEFPHVMLLIDDEKKSIIESIYNKRNQYKKLYDFDLMKNGGHIEGYFVNDYKKVIDSFNQLLNEERLIKKYGKIDKFMFAVGDGNHSLATAKAYWENIKKNLTKEEIENHPARFALCEIVNIYDDGIYFEPIFRFVEGIDVNDFVEKIQGVNGGKFEIYLQNKSIKINKDNCLADGIKETDRFIKDYIDKFGGKVDYIHGEDNLKNLVDINKNSVGIIFEKLDKKELFTYVSKKGSFPRKTFSMGQGIEKRYYLEGKRIKL